MRLFVTHFAKRVLVCSIRENIVQGLLSRLLDPLYCIPC